MLSLCTFAVLIEWLVHKMPNDSLQSFYFPVMFLPWSLILNKFSTDSKNRNSEMFVDYSDGNSLDEAQNCKYKDKDSRSLTLLKQSRVALENYLDVVLSLSFRHYPKGVGLIILILIYDQLYVVSKFPDILQHSFWKHRLFQLCIHWQNFTEIYTHSSWLGFSLVENCWK